MVFVSLTTESRQRAVDFVRKFSIPWACGYGANLEEIAQWGAYSAEFLSAGPGTGYEVRPTLYLLGPDGRVLWCDDQARPRHRAGTPELLRRLDSAIRAALARTKGRH